jgi:hypothetical protein
MTDLLRITVVRNWANVTPLKHLDYVAYVEGQEERAELYGFGETREEALAELGVSIVERVDDRLFDLRESGAIDQATADECFTDIDGLAYLPY